MKWSEWKRYGDPSEVAAGDQVREPLSRYGGVGYSTDPWIVLAPVSHEVREGLYRTHEYRRPLPDAPAPHLCQHPRCVEYAVAGNAWCAMHARKMAVCNVCAQPISADAGPRHYVCRGPDLGCGPGNPLCASQAEAREYAEGYMAGSVPVPAWHSLDCPARGDGPDDRAVSYESYGSMERETIRVYGHGGGTRIERLGRGIAPPPQPVATVHDDQADLADRMCADATPEDRSAAFARESNRD